jgi:SAM-dependent methyltransferase
MSQAKDSNERHAVRRAFLRRDPRILYPLRRLLDPPERLIGPYIKPGMVAADLACAWGFYTFAMAERLGPEGKVYAVDLGAKCIRSIQKKAEKASYHNIEAHAASAAKMPFIPDRSVDFVLANGLLCSMENDRPQAVEEMQRILKPGGQAYISLGMPPPFGLVDQAEWERILAGFKVEAGGSFKELWALVSLKPATA